MAESDDWEDADHYVRVGDRVSHAPALFWRGAFDEWPVYRFAVNDMYRAELHDGSSALIVMPRRTYIFGVRAPDRWARWAVMRLIDWRSFKFSVLVRVGLRTDDDEGWGEEQVDG